MQRSLVGSEMCIRDRYYYYLLSDSNWKTVSYTHLTLPTTPYV
ncbi:hypothetical protein JMUB7514_27960 [Staphylococcus aureus]